MNTAKKIIDVVVRFTQQGLENIQTQINNLNNTTKDFNKSAKDASKSSKGLGDEVKKTGNAASNAGKQTEGASKATRSFGASVGRAINIVAQFTVAMTIVNGALALVRSLTIDAAKVFIEFESSLARLKAVTGATNAEITSLSESAKELALSTLFTSNEIVQLQQVLGKLGFSVEEITNSQRAIAELAQITGESLESTASLVGNALRAFELSASSAASVTNTFTAAITSSALSQEYLRTSLQYVAPIAAQLGLSVSESASALGVLADSGFTASRAGTGLRMTLLELGKSGESLSETIQRLRDQNISLTEAQELVGVRGAGSLLTLINNFERFNKILEETADASATVEANLAVLSSTQASFDQLGVAIEERLLKPLGEFLLDLLYIKGAAIELIAIFDKQAAAQLSLADALSKLPDFYKESLLNTELDAEAREKVLDNALSLLSVSGELNAMDRGRYLFSKNNMLAVLEEEVENLREQEKIEKTRTRVSKELSQNIDDRLNAAIGFKGVEETINSINAELSGKIKEQKDLIEELKKTDDDRLKTEEAKLDVLIQQQKVLQGSEGFQIGLERLTSEKQLNDAIKDRQKSIEGLQEILNNENITLDYRLKAYDRLVIKQEELAAIEKKRNEIYGKPIEEKAVTEDTIESFRKLYNLQKSLNEAITEGDIPLANRLAEEYQTALQALEKSGLTEEYQDFARKLLLADSDTIEELVKQYKDIIDEIIRAQEVGDDVALAKSTAELGKLLQEIQTLGIGKDFVSVYDAIFDEEQRKKALEILAETRKNLDKENKEREKEAEERRKQEEKEQEERKKLIIQQAEEIANAGVDAAFEATRRRLQAEQEAVDARYSYEEDRLQSLVDNNLITQAEYERKREQLERERIEKTNEIEKKQFESDKARALVDLAIDTAIAIASRGFEPIQSSIILAASAIQAGIISAQKFIPVQFEEGGLVQGRSHEQGGIPFTVQGQGGYEMEGGEYIVNKEATSKHLSILEQINSNPQAEYIVNKEATSKHPSIVEQINSKNPVPDSYESILYAIKLAILSNKQPVESNVFQPIPVEIILDNLHVKQKFEDGGMVYGRSHREGGVPFTVQGIGGYEMEGGEYIVNKKATAKYLPMLEQINSYGKLNNSMFKQYANGGLTGMEGAMGMGESTRINAMLLQRLNQPIRAYVSERELMTKSNERINQKMKSRL